jgi:hypothetical protein
MKLIGTKGFKFEAWVDGDLVSSGVKVMPLIDVKGQNEAWVDGDLVSSGVKVMPLIDVKGQNEAFFDWVKETVEADSGPPTKVTVRHSDGREVLYQILREIPGLVTLANRLASGDIVQMHVDKEIVYLKKFIESTPCEVDGTPVTVGETYDIYTGPSDGPNGIYEVTRGSDAGNEKWGWSSDGETYTICEDREECIQEAYEGCKIARMAPIDWLPAFVNAINMDGLIESAEDYIYTNTGCEEPGEHLDATEPMREDLETRLSKCIEDWLEQHGIRFGTWYQVIDGTAEELVEDPRSSDECPDCGTSW